MVVVPAALDALGRPAADVAVLDGLGIGLGRRIGGPHLVRHRREESVAGAPVVRHVVVDAQPLHGPGAAAERDVQPLRADALDPFELVDVRADLQDRARLDVAGELGVGDLVVVRAPDRRPIRVVDPQQEVGVAAPRPVEERRLVDDVGAGGHRGDRFGGRGSQSVALILDRPVRFDLDRRASRRLQVGEVALLVLEAALADDVELGIVAHRPLDEVGQGGPLELGEVLAGQIGDQVRRGEDGSPIDQLHASTIARVATACLSRGALGARAPRASVEQRDDGGLEHLGVAIDVGLDRRPATSGPCCGTAS